MRLVHLFRCLSMATLLFVSNARAVLVYSNDFEGTSFQASGVTATGFSATTVGQAIGTITGANGKKWSGQFALNNQPGPGGGALTQFTLSGLGSHDQISVDFLLGFLRTWDSNNGISWASPDYLEILVDNLVIGKLTTAVSSGSNSILLGGTQLVNDQKIHSSLYPEPDDLVDMATAAFLTFSHSSSTLTLGIRASGSGWQAGDDEYWGIDAVRVSMRTPEPLVVPEPATLALFGVSLLALAHRRRRARTARH